MTIEWWLTYLLTTTILSLSPGSGAINTMSTGISHGYRGTVASISGLQVGLAVHIVLVGIGLGALFSQSLLAFEILKWAGAAYLVWLGIQQWRSAGGIDLDAVAKAMPRRRLFKRAVLVKYRFPGRAVSAVHPAASAAIDAVRGAGRDHRGGRYYRDDWLRHLSDAHCGLD